MRLPQKISALFKDTSASTLIATAAAVPLLVGSAGLATDTVQWALWKRQLQRAADSGALAGAYARAQGKAVADTVNGDLAKDTEITIVTRDIQNAPTSGPYAGDATAVKVVLTTAKTLPFTSMFLSAPPTIRAEATAAMVSNGHHCVIALEHTTNTGITMIGNATVTLGCGMATNSMGSNAVIADGSAVVRANPITAVGGIASSGSYVTPTVLQPYSLPQPDPFASLSDPVLPPLCHNKVTVGPSEEVDLLPGCYKGMDLKGEVNLAPGEYYIDGGSLDIGSQAVISGEGVTIILTSANAVSNPSSIATLNINAGAEIDLTAPTSGAYAGILLYQDRRALDGQSNKLNGNSASRIRGAVYMPKQQIEFTGTTSMDTQCVQLVGRRVTFSGNSVITNTCPTGSGAHNFIGSRVQLVG